MWLCRDPSPWTELERSLRPRFRVSQRETLKGDRPGLGWRKTAFQGLGGAIPNLLGMDEASGLGRSQQEGPWVGKTRHIRPLGGKAGRATRS